MQQIAISCNEWKFWFKYKNFDKYDSIYEVQDEIYNSLIELLSNKWPNISESGNRDSGENRFYFIK